MNRRQFIKVGALFLPVTAIAGVPVPVLKSYLKGEEKGSGAASNNTFVTATSGGANASAFNGRVGMEFQPSVNMTITAIGYLVNTGNTGTRTVWLSNDIITCSDIITDTIPDVTGLDGNWVYKSITPTALVSGTKYVIYVQAISGQNYHDDTGSITTTSDAVVTASTYYDTSCHTSQNGVHSFGMVNFKYTVP